MGELHALSNIATKGQLTLGSLTAGEAAHRFTANSENSTLQGKGQLLNIETIFDSIFPACTPVHALGLALEHFPQVFFEGCGPHHVFWEYKPVQVHGRMTVGWLLERTGNGSLTPCRRRREEGEERQEQECAAHRSKLEVGPREGQVLGEPQFW
jgi:hypothetical protein